jgi:formiminotetrahydrofolate cyclodeaminase
MQDGQILEHRLAMLEPAAASNDPAWLEALAAGTATPGGGAAAAYAGAMAAALVGMVARLTVTNKRYREAAAAMQEATTTADTLRTALSVSVSADSAAFAAVLQAARLSHTTPDATAARTAAMEQALHGATMVPLQVARQAIRVLEVAALLADKGNVNAMSDVGTAAHLALAVVQGAVLNVRTNAVAVHDRAVAEQWLHESARLEQQALAAADTVNRLVSCHLASAPEPAKE